MVWTSGLKWMLFCGLRKAPTPGTLTNAGPPGTESDKLIPSKKAMRYSVFMNQPGAEIPKMFRLFSTPPPTNQPLRLNEGVPNGVVFTVCESIIVVPDQFDPV